MLALEGEFFSYIHENKNTQYKATSIANNKMKSSCRTQVHNFVLSCALCDAIFTIMIIRQFSNKYSVAQRAMTMNETPA